MTPLPQPESPARNPRSSRPKSLSLAERRSGEIPNFRSCLPPSPCPVLIPRLLLLAALLLATLPARPDAGTLIPRDKDAPDPAILSLSEMSVDILIDNGDARIRIVQIFQNHTKNVEEGTYRFSLPTAATVSDFAVWDGPVRIPAVILERKRAEQVYDQARLQAIDPGLLEAGERDSTDPRTSAPFTAKIVPIPAYGTKRLELEYHQRILTADFKQFFALPLKPDAAQKQSAAHFTLHFLLRSAHPIQDLQTPSKLYPLHLTASDPYTAEGTFEAANISLDEDFGATWRLSPDGADKLEVIIYHNPINPLPTPGTPSNQAPSSQLPKPTAHESLSSEPGFFQAQLLLADPPASATASPPRTVILLFDTSLSMQWDKLERTYAALEATLRSLRAADHFNLLLFNAAVTPFQPQPIPADSRRHRASPQFRPREQAPRRHRPRPRPHRRPRPINRS